MTANNLKLVDTSYEDNKFIYRDGKRIALMVLIGDEKRAVLLNLDKSNSKITDTIFTSSQEAIDWLTEYKKD